MNLSQLEVLVAIVDTGSLTEAGEVVGLTQSAVSYSLSKLEAELGVTLLERGRQGITVTRVGQEVLNHARNVITQVEVIRQKTARERGLAVGKIRFGCVPSVPPRLLTGILRDFQHQYPDIEIVLFEGIPQELVDWLGQGVVDVATVVASDGYDYAVPLVQDEIKVLLSPKHALAAQTAVSLAEFVQQPLIGPRAEYGVLKHIVKVPDMPTLHLRYQVSTQNTIFTMVRENMGISMMPEMLFSDDMVGITARSFAPPLIMRVYLAANNTSPAIHAFLNNAHAWAQSHGFLPVNHEQNR